MTSHDDIWVKIRDRSRGSNLLSVDRTYWSVDRTFSFLVQITQNFRCPWIELIGPWIELFGPWIELICFRSTAEISVIVAVMVYRSGFISMTPQVHIFAFFHVKIV